MIGDGHARFQSECLDHLGGLLIAVPFRTVEMLQILFDVVRAAMLVLLFRVRRSGKERAQDREPDDRFHGEDLLGGNLRPISMCL